MQTNESVITKFYTAFQQRDAATMNSCYNEDIVFSDPAFGLLKGDEVRAMWEMLCKNAKDFSLKAFMRLKDGKIIEHSDAFKLSKWASQALGWKGALFGWMGWMQRKIQKGARKSLGDFMSSR